MKVTSNFQTNSFPGRDLSYLIKILRFLCFNDVETTKCPEPSLLFIFVLVICVSIGKVWHDNASNNIIVTGLALASLHGVTEIGSFLFFVALPKVAKAST